MVAVYDKIVSLNGIFSQHDIKTALKSVVLDGALGSGFSISQNASVKKCTIWASGNSTRPFVILYNSVDVRVYVCNPPYTLKKMYSGCNSMCFFLGTEQHYIKIFVSTDIGN